MKQISSKGGERDIRPPHKLKGKAPKKPLVKAGPTICIKVPPGTPGTKILIPHPSKKGEVIADAIESGAAEDALADAGDAIADIAGDAGDAIADAAGDVGDALADVAADVGDWVGDAADDVGDWVGDLF